MRIIIDAENIANSRTGVPKVSLTDSIVFCEIFDQVEFYISKSASKELYESEEFNQLIKLEGQNLQKTVRVNEDRPSNFRVWISQSLPYLANIGMKHFDFSYSSLFPGIFGSSINCKNIVRMHDPFRVHGSLYHEFLNAGSWKNACARILRDRAFRQELQNNSLIVANSSWTRNLCLEMYKIDQERVDVVWPSVGFLRESKTFQSRRKKNPPYLICVMSQRQRKQPVFVINSWAKVASKLGIRLRVVGKVALTDLSTTALKKIDSGELVIHNYLDTQELRELQANAFASIFASTGEGFGLPIAESLFYGVPVLHNDLDVFKEVSAGVGIEFSLNSEESLVQALLNIASDEEYKAKLNVLSSQRGTLFSHEHAMTSWSNTLFN
jgi:glycosyltransferase involved in cell wall biosynthesis